MRPGEEDALAAARWVLRGFQTQRVSQRELERARMTLLTRHETELKTNAYWVDLMQYTALGDALAPAKDVTCTPRCMPSACSFL